VVCAEYASGDEIVGEKRIMTKPVGTVRQEVMEWFDKMFETKRFGRFSVEITMHEGDRRRRSAIVALWGVVQVVGEV
jgi:hypothetical protein